MPKPTAKEKKLEQAAETAWTGLQQAVVLHGRKRGTERQPIDLARAKFERAIAERAGKVTQPPASERELYVEQGRDEVRQDIGRRLAAVIDDVLEGVAKDAEWDEDVIAAIRPAFPGIANRVLVEMGYPVADADALKVTEDEDGDQGDDGDGP